MQQTVVSIIPFYDNKQLYSYEHLQTGLMSFASTPSALHSRALVSFPVMAVVSALTLQWDSSLQHYRPDRTTHSDLQLLLLQGHLDHNHSWTVSIRLSLSPSACLPILLLHKYKFTICPTCKLSLWIFSYFCLYIHACKCALQTSMLTHDSGFQCIMNNVGSNKE